MTVKKHQDFFDKIVMYFDNIITVFLNI